jgi:hypothetical protein
MQPRSDELKAERAALLAEIDAAFDNVRRDGGVSWSESKVIDNHGSSEERQKARESDTDPRWNELVDQSGWRLDIGDSGIGGFSFLDAIGFRYYLPAAMKRSVLGVYDGGVGYHLRYGGKLDRWLAEQHSLLDRRQQRCVARYLRYMIDVSRQPEHEWGEEAAVEWTKTLDSHWLQFANGSD